MSRITPNRFPRKGEFATKRQELLDHVEQVMAKKQINYFDIKDICPLWYAGSTHDPKDREGEHENKPKLAPAKYFHAVHVHTYEIACALETHLQMDYGFQIGIYDDRRDRKDKAIRKPSKGNSNEYFIYVFYAPNNAPKRLRLKYLDTADDIPHNEI